MLEWHILQFYPGVSLQVLDQLYSKEYWRTLDSAVAPFLKKFSSLAVKKNFKGNHYWANMEAAISDLPFEDAHYLAVLLIY